MGQTYDLSIICHSKESKPKMKTFINLDGNALGFELNEELGSIRFFIYKQKRKHQLAKSSWCKLSSDKDQFYKALYTLVQRYYKLMGRLEADGELPMYTQMELRIPASHLHYHINAETLDKVLKKEVIYN